MPDLYPAVLGHEGAGIVERVGQDVTKVHVGDHVVVTYTSCGECKYCLRKETSYCDSWFKYNFGGGRLDGSKVFSEKNSGKRITSHFFGQSSFARHTLVSQEALIKVDKNIPFRELAPLGCGLQTGAGAMLNVIQPTHDMTVAVVGVGVVGLAAIMACKLLPRKPTRVIAVDIVPARLEMARKYGATHGINSKVNPDLFQSLMDISKGEGIDGSIDTTGRPQIIKHLANATARKGKIVSVGVGALDAEASFNIFNSVNAGASYIGCCEGNCYPPEFIPRLLAAKAAGGFPFDELIKDYSAKDMDKAAHDIHSGSTVKAVLLWD
jgi:aryl-alcohol dehydrogenase